MKQLRCDVFVAGAGMSGMCAAIAAARHGLSVILVNDRSVLGGNASSEIGVGISGSNHGSHNTAIYGKETGIIEEIRLRLEYYRSFEGYGKEAVLDAVFFDMIYNEKNIKLFLNTVVGKCEVENAKITKVYMRHSVNSNEYEVTADCYIDATGNGALGYEAGAEYRIGREGKDEYGELWAPDKADDFTMGNSIYFETADAGREVEFKAPDFAHDISKMDFMKDIDKPENFRGLSCFGPHWAYEYGGQVDILNDHDDIELELRKLIYGIWDYVKNSGKYPRAKTRYLKRVFAKAGTRESRRFIGDHVLNENDVENKVNFEDSVAMGGWHMDIHAPLGIYDSLPASNFVPVTGIYNIPFRSLYSKNIENLMMAGRNISATHIALGSTRVMGTCACLGQAVGTAAYLIKKYGETPRGIYNNHIKELQQLLIEDDQSILHIKEKAPSATVSATSVKTYENTSLDGYMPLERDYALALMMDSKRAESVDIFVKASNSTQLNYKILTGTHPETYLPENITAKSNVLIGESFEGWLNIPLNCEVGADGKIFIVFEKNDDIELGISEKRTMGAVTNRMHTKESCDKKNHDSIPLDETKTGYTHFDHDYEEKRNILFKDLMPKQSVFAPENVINGYSRPYGTQNLWLADMNEPQTLTVIPTQSADIKDLTLILDNRLDLDEPWKYGLPSTLAKDFDISITASGEVENYSVRDNYKRMVKIPVNISGVTKIEITFAKTNGNEVGVYAIKF